MTRETVTARRRPHATSFVDKNAAAGGALPTELHALFKSDAYSAAVDVVCHHKPVQELIEAKVVLQLPGTAVPMQYDVPSFWGVPQHFPLPQWLLVVMDQSGLWRDRRVSQLHGTAYLHDWEGWE